MPKQIITVAVPFARESLDYVRLALRSLFGQDFREWTAFLLDDSPGGAPEVERLVNSFGDTRLTYRRREGTHGIGDAWNACVAAAETEFLSLLHSDDELEPHYLSTMLRLAKRAPTASAYFCGATVIDRYGRPCFSLPDRAKDLIEPRSEPVVVHGPQGIGRLIVGNYIMCPTLMYRLAEIGDRRFSSNHRFVLDFRFTLGLLVDGGTIVGTHAKAYRYRRHQAQATALLSKAGDRFQEELDLFREVETIAALRGWRRVQRIAHARPIFRINAALSGKPQFLFR